MFWLGRLIYDLARNFHRGLFCVNVRRCNENAPVGKMHGIGRLKPDVSINAGSGVPSGRRLTRIINADRDHIVAAGFEMAGHLVLKAHISVRPIAEMKAVDPNIAVCHHAVKIDKDAAVRIARPHRKMLSIPADASR